MIIYLTFNDAPSGIYAGQVIEVVRFLNKEMKQNIKLIAFISLRGFWSSRKKIKSDLGAAIVLPMFPGIKRWKRNRWIFRLVVNLYKPSTIISRSVLATQIALTTKCKRIVYDGRGAIAAEWNEYQVVNDAGMLREIYDLEWMAIHKSQFRIAVSNKLLEYWKDEYKFQGELSSVIPCTLNGVFENVDISEQSISEAISNLGFKRDDVVFVYSGSVAGWQSFSLLYHFITPVLKKGIHNKILFLSGKDKNIERLQLEFPGQVVAKHVAPKEVPRYLIACDYGLLIREESVTNSVASPVKFAEYLSCGLKVILSENLGDYSRFVKDNNCGFIYTDSRAGFEKITIEDKRRLSETANSNFTKRNFRSEYNKVIGRVPSRTE